MKYKLFLSDYDGTLGLLTNIDKDTVLAIKDYQSRGGKFVICTGRSFYSILPVIEKYDIKGDIITYQGAVIKNIESGKLIYDGEMDKKLVIDIVEKLENEGLSVGIYIDDNIHYSFANNEMLMYIKHISPIAFKEENLINTLKNATGKIRKLVALGKEKEIAILQKKYNKEYEGRLIVNSSSSVLIEVINPANSKGEGVRRIADYYGIPLSEVITVGDSLNDVELVRGEWHGVAVGDAVNELKKVAKEVTVDFNNHPIKTLLEKYGR